MVIIAGNGHVRYKYGIPDRLYRRNQEPFAVIVQDEEIENGIADFILLTTELKGKESPRLGVLIEPKEKGLAVVEVGGNTPAKKAGLKKGDIIIMLAGRSIESMTDLKLALLYSQMGSTVNIQVKRGDKTLDKKIKLFRFSPHSR
jgi:S1-C subfamily serine protease